MSHWHFMLWGKPFGPLSFDALKELAESKQLLGHHQVRYGDGPWVPASSVEGLFSEHGDQGSGSSHDDCEPISY
ncbi:MAG: DUF4339 domain-containing protein [Pirellula sp.]|jgi:hypothetical protein|nr:DUF4339 domain-containing protein [Pirellula sp.]